MKKILLFTIICCSFAIFKPIQVKAVNAYFTVFVDLSNCHDATCPITRIEITWSTNGTGCTGSNMIPFYPPFPTSPPGFTVTTSISTSCLPILLCIIVRAFDCNNHLLHSATCCGKHWNTDGQAFTIDLCGTNPCP